MAKKTKAETPAPQAPLYIIRTGVNPTTWVAHGGAGPIESARTTEPGQAAAYTDEGQASQVARAVGGTVHLYAEGQEPRLNLVPQTIPMQPAAEAANAKRRGRIPVVQEPTTSSGQAAPAPARETKARKAGVSREDVVALLSGTGLPLTQKSSDHYGDIKGPRLVLPKSASVTRLFLYKMPDATALPGYKTPEERKAAGLGAVTHVADVTTMDQVRELVAAVCLANGLKAPKPPKARTRKPKTPAEGVPATEQPNAEAQ